ncbi:MAG: threonine-phosphate decarboxylase CobD [Syntrophomonadaceae bacterium]|nr:threonine-phosphate decarboxylase CobD [Syntrophomonadaceae bacterium]MDD3889131.1 threonine-phosphate decarboxylase CobD [Syntrophomonadaceae bacterium]MDD4549549.1 threonine-phosphate decarboxylase CobD [Syntrophomonadaceae bacterium]
MHEKERIHGGNVYEVAEQYGLNIEDILDFSASVSPLGVPEVVLEALKNSLGTVVHYPDPNCLAFRQAVAAELGISSENILAGNGAAELIYLIVQMVLPRCTVIPIPTFSEYEYAVSSVGGNLKYIQLQAEGLNFSISIDDFCKSLRGADLAFICNPNNPTATLFTRNELQKILEAGNANHCLIVVDEAYLDFVQGGSDYSLVNQILDYDNLLILKSLTKIYSLPGLRIGYAIGNKDLINKMNNLRDPWSVNSLAQAAGVAALSEKDYRTRLQELVWKERQYLYEEIKQLPGLRPYFPTANFMLVNTHAAGITAIYLHEILARTGLLIRDCTSFNGMGSYFFRIAVRKHSENMRLIQALDSALQQESGVG